MLRGRPLGAQDGEGLAYVCVLLYGWTPVWESSYPDISLWRGEDLGLGNFHSITTIILMGIWEWVMGIGFPFLSLSILFLFVYARRWGLGWGSFVQAQARQRSLIGSCMGAGPALLVAGQVGEERDDI